MKIIKEKVSTNNFLISKEIDYTKLEGRYQVLKYTLTETQNNFRVFADKHFYARFTNNYKENFDTPFYYHVHTGLYAIVPIGNPPKKWSYKFSDLEEIEVSQVSFDELELHILMKLLIALFFYNESEQQRRVCQSRFFVVGKNRGNKLTCLQFELKQLGENEETVEFHIKSPATNFIKRDRSKINPQFVAAEGNYELLTKEGVTYLRQLRPSKVKEFAGDVYSNNIPFKIDKAHLDWYSDANHTQTKAYLIHTFKERFKVFLESYDIRYIEKTQEFLRLEKYADTQLPLHLLGTIKVLDNRLSKKIPIENYLGLFSEVDQNQLKFELTNIPKEHEPLLVVQDCDKKDFINNETEKGILTDTFSDPYKELYSKFPNTPKQTLIVNLQDGSEFTNPIDYLDYEFINDENKEFFTTKFEVCLNELFLKSILLGQISLTETLPFISENSEILEWGFIKDKVLMYFQDAKLMFGDLSTKTGKEILSHRFIRWSELLKAFKSRRPFVSEEDLEDQILKSVFILRANSVLEIERLDETALPEIGKIEEVKSENAKKSARTRESITVYSGGIWYNENENTYIVSGTHSMNWREARGHHIYKIHQYQTEGSVNLKLVVKLLCVKFVRNKQYTVYPYFFDLLRLNGELRAVVQEAERP